MPPARVNFKTKMRATSSRWSIPGLNTETCRSPVEQVGVRGWGLFLRQVPGQEGHRTKAWESDWTENLSPLDAEFVSHLSAAIILLPSEDGCER